MRTPPADTVPHDRVTDPARAEGIVDGVYVDRIPLAVDRAFVQRGHDRFDVFCAPCHGVAGDGDSIVADNMHLRRPPSIATGGARDYPDGRLFAIVTHGYGLMRSYAEDLSIDERWATIAYLRALQLRQGIPMAALPHELRERAESELARRGEGERP
jgi:mono/diheme cytochrome c family protein